MSDIDFEKVAEAIEKSSEEVKTLLFSIEYGEKLQKIIEGAFIEDKEIALKIIDEVGYAILDLKPKNLLYDSLNKLGVNNDTARKISKEVETEVFAAMDQLKNNRKELPEEKGGDAELPNIQNSTQNNIGQSFEDIILNQAKAMQPARIPGEKPASNIPHNLPTEKIQNPPEKTEEKPREMHNYAGQDPYREPIE